MPNNNVLAVIDIQIKISTVYDKVIGMKGKNYKNYFLNFKKAYLNKSQAGCKY